MEEYKRFTISLPSDLYEQFETFRKELDLSRSDCIRKAMKTFMTSEKNISISTGNVVGCISMIISHEHFDSSQQHAHPHDHDHDHGLDQTHYHDHEYSSGPIYANVQQTDLILMNDIQHHFGDVIISTLHVHLEFEKCLEIIAFSGRHDRVIQLKKALQRLKSVLTIEHFVVDREILIKNNE